MKPEELREEYEEKKTGFRMAQLLNFRNMIPKSNGPRTGLSIMNTYAGTVPQKTVDQRRAKNRVARKSRRANRRK